jgi:pimeloyl-ACP methyl ester carboxylesterase
MQNILAIHGAFSSPRIFNFLHNQLSKKYHWIFLDYRNQTSGLSGIMNSIQNYDNVHVVGHSMGGLIALGIINQPWVKSITTIATPLGGVDVNLLQSYWTRSDFINDIASHGDFIKRLRQMSNQRPVQHILSISGFSPWLYEPNDGVITLRSQRAYALGQVYEIDANHAEVMLDPETVKILDKFWQKHS